MSPREPRFLLSELAMILRRRRNQAMLGALFVIPVVIAVAVKLQAPHGGGRGDTGGALFGNITENGVFVAFSALFVVLTLFLPLTTAVVAGESIAGEASSGTLRYLLVVPVGRTRLLLVKYAGILTWCVLAPLVVAVAGLLAGLVFFPSGDIVLLSGTPASMASALGRLAMVTGYAAVMMAAVGAIGLFVSTLTEVPVAAMAATLAVAIASEVLDAVPQLHTIQPWLFSHYWLQFGDLLRDPISYDGVRHGMLVSIVYALLFLSLAWARFGSKDVTS
jgi:ABC-2 type transport system permease protein